MISRTKTSSGCTLLLVLALTGCVGGPGGGGETIDASATSSSSSASASASVSASSTSAAATSASTSAAAATSDASGDASTDTAATTCTFVCDDTGDPPTHCDPYSQDCPEGQKCTYTPDLQSARCVDVAPRPHPPGEPCTQGDEVGLDDCDVGGICWYVDAETGVGECVGICQGSRDTELTCAAEGTTCWYGCQTCIGMCFPDCDPLDADACGPGQVCVLSYADVFFCAIDASGAGGGHGDPCDFLNGCDPGHACVALDSVPECTDIGQGGCCAALCDLNTPACPDADLGVVCHQYAETPKPGYEHVGVCTLPP